MKIVFLFCCIIFPFENSLYVARKTLLVGKINREIFNSVFARGISSFQICNLSFEQAQQLYFLERSMICSIFINYQLNSFVYKYSKIKSNALFLTLRIIDATLVRVQLRCITENVYWFKYIYL